MKNIQFFAILIIAVTLLINSCKKEIDSPINKKSINSVLQSKRPTDQVFNVTAGRYQTIQGANGTIITFNPSSFQNRDGSIITSGTIKVTLRELYGVGEMMSYNAITTSGGKLLQSGGEIYLKATKDGAEVLSNGANVRFPTTNFSQPMNLFYGDIEVNPTFGDTTIVWSPVDSSNVTTPTIDSLTSHGYYDFYIDSFTYINCDYFYSYTSPLTDISLVSNDSMVDTNTAVFLYFPSINALSRVYSYNPLTHIFSLDNGYEIPTGLNFTVVAISEIDGNYYSYIQNHTATAGMSINMNFTPTTLAAFWAAVDAL